MCPSTPEARACHTSAGQRLSTRACPSSPLKRSISSQQNRSPSRMAGDWSQKKARSHCDPSFFLCCVRDPDLAPQGVSISSPYPPSPVGTGPCACPLIQLTTKSVGSRFRSCQPWMPKLSAKMRKSAKSIVKVSEAVSPSASNALNVEVASAITLGGLLDRVRVVGSNDSPSGEDIDQHPTGSYRVFPRAKWGCGSWGILFLVVCIPLHIRDE